MGEWLTTMGEVVMGGLVSMGWCNSSLIGRGIPDPLLTSQAFYYS